MGQNSFGKCSNNLEKQISSQLKQTFLNQVVQAMALQITPIFPDNKSVCKKSFVDYFKSVF